MFESNQIWTKVFVILPVLGFLISLGGCAPSLHELAKTGQSDQIKSMTMESGTINALDKDGNTPLIIAIENKKDETVKALVEQGADVNKKGKNCNTPLIISINNKTGKITEYLLQQQADIAIAGFNGNTALLSAVNKDDQKIVNKLISMGADITVKNDREETALMLAAENANLNLVKQVLEAGVDVNAVDTQGANALCYAASEPEIDKKLVLFIIKMTKDKSATQDAKDLFSLLINLRKIGINDGKKHIPIAEYLLANGARINDMDQDNWNAITYAAIGNRLEMVKFLSVQGGNSQQKDLVGMTPQNYATAFDYKTTADYLASLQK